MRKPSCEKKEKIKGAWSKQEDQKLIDYINQHGQGCWRSLPQAAGLLRCGKSCRLRWMNYLRPELKHGNFGDDEVDLIIKLHALLGNRWSLIAGRLPGRTDNEVKNYWNTRLRKKLEGKSIDPNNHNSQNQHATSSSSSSWTSDNTTTCKTEVCNGDHNISSPVLEYSSSCPGSDASGGGSSNLPDLNFDLTMNGDSVKEERARCIKNLVTRKRETAVSPTLLLF